MLRHHTNGGLSRNTQTTFGNSMLDLTVEGPLLFSIYVVVVTPFSPQKKRDESSVRTQTCRFSPNGACGKMFLSDSKYISRYLSVSKKIKILCF